MLDTFTCYTSLRMAPAVAGSSLGAFVGYLRSQNVGWYATTMGLNFAVFGGLYFGTCSGDRDVM